MMLPSQYLTRSGLKAVIVQVNDTTGELVGFVADASGDQMQTWDAETLNSKTSPGYDLMSWVRPKTK